MTTHQSTHNDAAYGIVTAVCISRKKGERKFPVSSAHCRANYGIEGDAHAGSGMRQVSFLAQKDIDTMKEHGISLKPGDFAENVIVNGDILDTIQPGEHLVIKGGAAFRVTMIGKKCHDNACPIRQQTGNCIMPSRGIFTEVVQEGELKQGDTLVRYTAEEYQDADST